VQLCGTTFRAGDRGATNDMLVQSLRLQCRAREARAAGREDISFPILHGLQTARGTTQLMRAAILNNLPRVLQLIQLGVSLDLVEETNGSSALHWASALGHEHVAKALLDGKYEGRGATVGLSNKYTVLPLMHASQRGHEAVARLLLARGAKVALQDTNGLTALHHAVGGDRPSIVALLCAAPGAAAALALKNNAGPTPLALATSMGRAACEAALRAHGATA